MKEDSIKDNICKYYITKNSNEFEIIVEKFKNEIKIIYKSYESVLNLKDLSKFEIPLVNSIEHAYKFINNIFKDNKVIILEYKKNMYIKLSIKFFYNNTEKDIETILYNKEKPNINFTLINDSYIPYALDNTFIVFKSIDNIIYLIYTNKNKSLVSYNLIDNKKINEIKNCHKSNISNFRYYFDMPHKRDLIISISATDNNIKLWNVNNWDCLLNLQNINKSGYLESACFLNENNNIYIITSNFYYYGCEEIKVFDLEGNKIKEIKYSNDKIHFIESYYDIKYKRNYIITGNIGYVKSYNYNENKIYHKYDDNNKRLHYCIVINNNGLDIIKLIESCMDGKIRVWNFHTGELLKKINANNKGLSSISLINNNYLFAGCNDKKIILINLENGNTKNFIKLNQNVATIKIINHPIYEECLIFQKLDNNQIELMNINFCFI